MKEEDRWDTLATLQSRSYALRREMGMVVSRLCAQDVDSYDQQDY
jgi:hypothetical protein